jgi:hypothetical protein
MRSPVIDGKGRAGTCSQRKTIESLRGTAVDDSRTDGFASRWRKTTSYRQEHKSFVYDIKVCPFEVCKDLFVTVGGADVTLMRVDTHKGRLATIGKCHVRMKQRSVPSGAQENLYVCEWLLCSDETLYMLAAGLSGTIYVVRANTLECTLALQGHGNSIVCHTINHPSLIECTVRSLILAMP